MAEPNEADRLAKLYAAMSDGELEKVASEGDELTADARDALRAEIAKRGLPIELPEPLPEVEIRPELQKWIVLRRFRDLPEAILAKGSLESSSIECVLTDENMVRLDWFISNGIGNVKLNVKPEDVEAAEAVLSQPIPEEFDYGDESAFEQPTCPKCGSLDITFETLNKPIAYATAGFLHFPLPVKSEKWICNACGVRWVVEEDDEPAAPAENL